jgi:hypothetical protein
MKAYVDVEGSGQGVTIVKSQNSSTILGADGAELRELTVLNSGSGTFQECIAVYTATIGFRVSDVTATTVSTGTYAFALSGHGTFKNLTLNATGATNSAGWFDNSDSISTLTNSIVSGGTYSVLNNSGVGHIAGSQLVGAALGTFTCVASYNGSYTVLDANCN